MTETKSLALDHLNQELSTAHSSALDKIHNWICDQEDEALFQNIVKKGKSLKDGLQYVANEVRKLASNGVAVMDDLDVYKLIVKYYEMVKSSNVED